MYAKNSFFQEKCHQYYPTIRETFRYENMTIRCTSELDYRTHTQRTLVLQKVYFLMRESHLRKKFTRTKCI